MEYFFLFLMTTLAIERLTEITTTVDSLECLRAFWEKMFPKVQLLATCKFCQTFWLSGIIGIITPFSLIQGLAFNLFIGFILKSFILWLSLWGMALIWSEFMDRYLNRAPINLFVMKPTDDQESEIL